jgi:MFS family permease
VRHVVLSLWALFAGLGLLMLGNGLQGTLLGIRASLSGFGTGTTGVVMACYYLGYMLGSVITPPLIRRVGGIRVFAALASLVSFAPLAHALFVNPVAWALLRLMAGACMVGIFIVAESWLNSAATNATRGRLLAVYLLVCQIAMAGGQYLLGFADPRGFELFVLVSALFSIAVVPIALTRRAVMQPGPSARIALPVLVKRIPLCLTGLLLVSLAYGSFYGMGAVYALEIGLERSQIASFMASTIIGSVLLQWPIGMLSDRMDRRRLIMLLCSAVTVVGLLLALVPPSQTGLLYTLMFLFGGLSLPLYGIFVALAGDMLAPEELVAASSKILLVNGLGSAIGPVFVAWLMHGVGTAGYALFIAVVHAAAAMITMRSLMQHRSQVVGHPAHFTAITPQASVVATQMAGRVAGEP